jgi:hypothetical protein
MRFPRVLRPLSDRWRPPSRLLSYPNAAGFDRCTYSHETRNIIDRTTNLCVSSLGLQACTTTVSSSRRRRVETPYSRALKARQWSKDKLAKKIMKKDV